MRWPWKMRPSDRDAAERGRALDVRTQMVELQARAAIAHAQSARARANKHIRENHLGPTFDAAFKESPR